MKFTTSVAQHPHKLAISHQNTNVLWLVLVFMRRLPSKHMWLQKI